MRFLSPLLVSRALFFVWSRVEYGRERSSSSFLCHHHHTPCRRRLRKRRRKAWSSRRPSIFRLSVSAFRLSSSSRSRWSGSRFIMFSFSFVVWLEEVDFDERKRRKGPSFERRAFERLRSSIGWWWSSLSLFLSG